MRRYVLILFAILLPALLFAQSGKVRGTIKDKESGEPLIGVNVVIEGTTLGAATDVNGDYIILSVPPGVYTVMASLVGYAQHTVSNIRVSANLTTTQDFQLLSSAVQVTGVEIVAERPLIQRNTTNTVRLTTQEDMENLAIRGVQNIIALEAGVVQQSGRLFVRGGRDGEVAFFVDGANTTNPLTARQTVTVIQEAIEELQLQSGGYTAEFGGSNSGIVRTTLRSGTSDYHGSLDFRTDDFAKPGSKYLGSTSFGFRNAVLTASGPIVIKDLKFFVAGQHNYIRDRDQRWMVPFKFAGLRVDENDARFRRFADRSPMPPDSQAFLPGPIEFRGENYVPHNFLENNTLQGSLIYDFSPYKLRVSGSYTLQRNPSASNWPDALANVYRTSILREDRSRNAFAEVRFTHVVNNTTFYEVGVSGMVLNRRIFDPRFDNISPDGLPALTIGGSPFYASFRDNWGSYTDSITNAKLGYPFGFRVLGERRFDGPNLWSTIFGFRLNDPNAPNNSYHRSQYLSWSVSGDLTSQIQTNVELKAGGRVELGKARSYTVGNIAGAMRFLYGVDAKAPQTFNNIAELEADLARSATGNINHYGYDVFGYNVEDAITWPFSKSASGPDAPKKPLFASVYAQSKLEYRDLILNFGLRFEHLNTKAKTFPDAVTPDSFFNTSLDVIDYNKLADVGAFNLLLPRLSFSFPVTDNTVFYAQYGKYAQMPSLDQLYVGNTAQSRTVSPSSRGNAFLTPVGFLMKPERTTAYEMGFRQTLTDNFAFTVSGFHKDTKDQLSVRSVTTPTGTPIYTAYLNQDFGTIKGLELTLELRRTNRLAARINYTLSDARGTGSNSQTSFAAIESGFGRTTDFINPLGYNQTHRGTLLLDYRFARGDGGRILEGLGLNALLTFNSGHNYTRIKPPESLGQASAWNIGVYPLTDPRFSIPAEPINASSTPWFFNIDLSLSKMFWVADLNVEVYANILNVLNSKQVINVYPNTGTPQDDAWLNSPLAGAFVSIPNYVDFYNAINLDNQWAYRSTTGLELYGTPRQVRFGVKVEI